MSFLFAAALSLSLQASESAPVSLTSSDGTGLKLLSLTARAVVQDPLAFTELTLVFENPLPRVVEGQFRITLPQGAALSRFAMKVDGKWQEGEVVEKQAARRAYEDFLHRRQDPALLEQSAGNEFSARVFPIPARGQKELVLSYSHELVQRDDAYVLPLKGLPELGSLDVRVTGVAEGALTKTRFVPTADFRAVPQRRAVGARFGGYGVVRVVPVDGTAQDVPTGVLLLVDTSASRALGFDEQVKLVQALAAALAKTNPKLPLEVAAFDQVVHPLYQGPASGFGDAQVKALRALAALGASNVEDALAWAAKHQAPRLVLLTDGVATAGHTEGPNLAAKVLALKPAGFKRLDVVAVGGLRDDAALRRLVSAGLERDGAVLDGALGAAEVARRLQLATAGKLPVVVEGASFVWPTTLAGLQAGDAALVYAQLPPGAPLAVTVGGKKQPVAAADVVSVEGPLLERAWAQAKLSALASQLDQADGAPQKKELQAQAVALSTKYRVLCPYTALLVLETDADYARFNIDRKALADILAVDDGRVVLRKRSADSVVVAEAQRPAKAVQANKQLEKAGKADEGATRAPPRDEAAPKPAEDAKEEGKKSERADADEAEALPRQREAESNSARSMPAPSAAPPPPPAAMPSRPRPVARPLAEPAPAAVALGAPPASPGATEAPWSKGSDPYVGPFKAVMDLLAQKKTDEAVARARGWHEEQPGDLLALVAYGEALEAQGDVERAARAYGSVIDLFPARADLRRFAGVRLERLKGADALELARDAFEKAVEQRPDHPASHRLLTFALLKLGRYEQAFAAAAKGRAQQYPGGRFAGVERILPEDLGLVAAAWMKAEPGRAAELRQKLKDANGTLEEAPSLRFVLTWETDANDVDFHITDGRGGHAFYSARTLPSGGELYADVTTGYGPECFTIRLPRAARAYPYKLQAHYYSIGPMGAGMGKLQLIEHDGHGGLTFEERPYVVMVNQAYVDLGVVEAPR